MPAMRVKELAKEYGLTPKELMERLREMKIPAVNENSTLAPGSVSKMKKVLDSEFSDQVAQLEAEKAAEQAEEAEAEAAKAKAAAEERKRLMKEAKARRAAAKAAKESSTAEADAKQEEIAEPAIEQKSEPEPEPEVEKPAHKPKSVLEQVQEQAEALAKEEEASEKAEDVAEPSVEPASAVTEEPAKEAAPEPEPEPEPKPEVKPEPKTKHEAKAKPTKKPASPLDDLRSQIEAESARLEAEKKAAKAAKKKAKNERAKKYDESLPEGFSIDPVITFDDDPKGVSNETPVVPSDDDRYRRMAQQVQKLQRDKVLEEARAAVDAAENENGGRRKKKKERREEQKAERARKEREAKEAKGIVVEDDSVIKISTGVTVSEFAAAMNVPVNDVIKRLFLLGTALTVNQPMTDDLVDLIADDLGRKVKIMSPEEEMHFEFVDKEEDLKPRPPVVTVMGHVDHGKTSLLDAIRSTGVVATEAGGITQHIGASVTKLDDGRTITFIDTPGHEAFTTMRARGAAVTDVVVLVVAADDGVMPQTIEAIHHAEAAGVPIVVAVNKIDKAGADPTRVRQELTEHNIIPEEWGGQNMFVEVSAKKRLNIEELLETILLQADVLELKANPDTFASGFVIESNLDRGRGAVATVLVQRGTLHVGDSIVAGTTYGRVRALINPNGEHVREAAPSDPVEIMGLNGIPNAGDEFCVFEDERDARNLAEERALKQRLAAENKKSHVSLDDLFARIEEGNMSELNLVVKADVQGSIEALEGALDKMDQSEVRINVIHSAVGGITETDVTLAAASDAIIIGFGVRPESKAKAAAEREKVDIRTYRVIYQAIDDINAARVGLLAPEMVEVDTGMAEIRELFKVPKVGTVAGCIVHEGDINRTDKVRVVRNGTVVFEGEIASLRRFKDDVSTVHAGLECGIGVAGFNDIKEGDLIETYRIDAVARKE